MTINRLVLLTLIFLCSCAKQGPREMYPLGSHSAGGLETENKLLGSQIRQTFESIAGIEAFVFERGDIVLSLASGRTLTLGDMERWDFDGSGELAMLYAETNTSLSDLEALSPQRVTPPLDLLEAMHVDRSRSDKVALYELTRARSVGVGFYVLFLGRDRGTGENEVAAVFIKPSKMR